MTQAAADAGTATMIFALAVAGGLIVILGSLLWWLIKERLELTRRRFEAGAERMAKTDEAIKEHDAHIEALRREWLESVGVYVTRSDCQAVHARHEAHHEQLTRQVERFLEAQSDQAARFAAIVAELRTGVQTLSRILGQRIEVGKAEGQEASLG